MASRVVVVVHDDTGFLGGLMTALQRAGYAVAGFSETRAALAAIETDDRMAMIITRLSFPEGMPHGVSLVLTARLKRRDLKALFLAHPDRAEYAEGVGEVLATPVLAEDVVAKVREMMPLSD